MHLVMDTFLFDSLHSSALTVKFVMLGPAGQRRT